MKLSTSINFPCHLKSKKKILSFSAQKNLAILKVMFGTEPENFATPKDCSRVDLTQNFTKKTVFLFALNFLERPLNVYAFIH